MFCRAPPQYGKVRTVFIKYAEPVLIVNHHLVDQIRIKYFRLVDIIKVAPKETENPIHTKDEPVVQPERKKIPFPAKYIQIILFSAYPSFSHAQKLLYSAL